MRYKILLVKKHYADLLVEANSKEEAIRKALEGDYIKATEDEYLLPSSDYKVEDIQIVKNKKQKKI